MVIVSLYLLISIYFGRKNKVYYLIFPLALIQGPGTFVDQSFTLFGKTLFNLGATIFSDVIFLILIIYILAIFRNGKIFINNITTRLFLFYLGLLLILTFLSFLKYSETDDIFLTVRYLIYIPFGYLLWIKIYSSISREDFIKFLKLILYINIISSILYILNSSQIFNIFPKENIFQEVQIGRRFFYRDFGTIPIFAFFLTYVLFSYLLSGEKIFNKKLVLINLFLCLLDILFSFTRSTLISIFIGVILITILYFFIIERSKVFAKSRILIYLLILTIFSAVIIYLFYDEFLYFGNRVENAYYNQGKEASIEIRLAYTEKTMEILSSYGDLFFGVGFTKIHYIALGNDGAFAADSTLPLLLLHSGIIGTIFLYFIFLITLIQLFTKIKNKNWFLVSLSVMLLINYPLMAQTSFPMFSMSFLALAVVENNDLWQKSN